MSQALTEFRVPIDRAQALVRGLVRLLGAGACALAAQAPTVDWRLLWLTQKASFVALAAVGLLVVFVGLWWLVMGIRWAVLAAWPHVGIAVTPTELRFDLGPFGRQEYPWSQVRLDLHELPDPDLLDQLPDDAFVPRFRHKNSGEDLTRRLLLFGRLDAEELARPLRPYVERALGRGA